MFEYLLFVGFICIVLIFYKIVNYFKKRRELYKFLNQRIVKLCRENTMVKKRHLPYLAKIVDTCNKQRLDGSIVECGVWKGGIVMLMMYFQKKHNMEKDFYLYDTFEGMSQPSDKDGDRVNYLYNQTINFKNECTHDEWHNENKWCYAPIDLVKRNVEMIKYDSNKIHYIKGDICQTLNDTKNIPDKICILRLDTDFYDSTKKEFDVLFSKVVKNGYIIVDDYYSWQGSRKATDEFLEKNMNKLEIINKELTGGIFCLKKIV